jgi:hypothetical protein
MGANTHQSLGSGMFSALDLSFCIPCLEVQLEWSIRTDLNQLTNFMEQSPSWKLIQ